MLSLCSIRVSTHVEVADFVVDFKNSTVFVLTSGNLLMSFNIKHNYVENVLKLKGFFTRLFFLPLSGWLVVVDNRSEISILAYEQKLFRKVFETNLGLVHLKRLQEYNVGKLVLLDKEGELSFYKLDAEKHSLTLFHKFNLKDNQLIKDFLYIPSVRLTRRPSCSFGPCRSRSSASRSF